MGKIYLYAHAGSGNHGCEAIIRSTVKLLAGMTEEIILLSANPDEDIKYGIQNLCRIEADKKHYSKRSAAFLKA